MALTHHADLEMVIGDEWLIVGLLLDEVEQPIDVMSPGVQLAWTLVGIDGNQVPGLAAAATITPQPQGIVHIIVPPDLTRGLTPARYLDAIRVTVDGAPVTEWTGIILADADPFHSEIPHG